MAQLKSRANLPVVDSEGLLENIAFNGQEVEVGSDLYVDGDIITAGELITGDMTNVFALLNIQDATSLNAKPPFVTHICNGYNTDDVIKMIKKYNVNGFVNNSGKGVVAHITYIDESSTGGYPAIIISGTSRVNNASSVSTKTWTLQFLGVSYGSEGTLQGCGCIYYEE